MVCNDSRGMVYAVALGIVILLSAFSATLLLRSTSQVQIGERARNEQAAFHLADAAVDQAMVNLRMPGSADDVLSQTVAGGTYSILSAVLLDAETQQAAVRGVSGTSQRDVEVVIRFLPKSIFQFALFGNTQVTAGGSATTDSYDSSEGPYDDDPNSPTYNQGHSGDVGTNSTDVGGITMSGGSLLVDGQLAVGYNVADPESLVTGFDSAFVTGEPEVVSQAMEFPMPAVTVPPGLTCSDATISANTTVTLTPGDHCYRNLTLQGGGELTASGDVTVYLTGQLIAQGNSTVGVTSDPTRLLLLMTSGGEVTLEQGTLTGSTGFYGGLYGPSATINITGNAKIFGSIVAEQINLSGSAEIHYDETLSQDSDVSNLYQTSIVSWRDL